MNMSADVCKGVLNAPITYRSGTRGQGAEIIFSRDTSSKLPAFPDFTIMHLRFFLENFHVSSPLSQANTKTK